MDQVEHVGGTLTCLCGERRVTLLAGEAAVTHLLHLP